MNLFFCKFETNVLNPIIMKTTFNRFLYAAMAISAAVVMASCEKETQGGEDPQPEPKPTEPVQLATPELSVENQTSTSFTVTWKAVSNADSYTYTLNDGTAQTTTSTSAEFSELAAGTYTVKVMATSEDENYTDSEWASTSVTLEEAVEETFNLEVFLDEFDSYTRYNSLWYTITGSGVSAVKYCCTDNVGLSEEVVINTLVSGSENEGIYSLGSDELAMLATPEGFSSGFIGLDSATEYELDFYVTFASGQSTLYRETITTESAPDAGEEVEKWLGTWAISSDKSFSWVSDGQSYSIQVEDTPMSGTITISAGTGNQVVIDGLSALGEGETTTANVTADGKLELINNLAIGSADEDGYVPMWAAVGELSTGGYSVINGNFIPFSFTLEGDTATGTPYVGTIQGGATFTVVSYEIFEINMSAGYLGITTLGPTYAGAITLTKQAASSYAMRMIPAKTAKKTTLKAFHKTGMTVLHAN